MKVEYSETIKTITLNKRDILMAQWFEYCIANLLIVASIQLASVFVSRVTRLNDST